MLGYEDSDIEDNKILNKETVLDTINTVFSEHAAQNKLLISKCKTIDALHKEIKALEKDRDYQLSAITQLNNLNRELEASNLKVHLSKEKWVLAATISWVITGGTIILCLL